MRTKLCRTAREEEGCIRDMGGWTTTQRTNEIPSVPTYYLAKKTAVKGNGIEPVRRGKENPHLPSRGSLGGAESGEFPEEMDYGVIPFLFAALLAAIRKREGGGKRREKEKVEKCKQKKGFIR